MYTGAGRSRAAAGARAAAASTNAISRRARVHEYSPASSALRVHLLQRTRGASDAADESRRARRGVLRRVARDGGVGSKLARCSVHDADVLPRGGAAFNAEQRRRRDDRDSTREPTGAAADDPAVR